MDEEEEQEGQTESEQGAEISAHRSKKDFGKEFKIALGLWAFLTMLEL